MTLASQPQHSRDVPETWVIFAFKQQLRVNVLGLEPDTLLPVSPCVVPTHVRPEHCSEHDGSSAESGRGHQRRDVL